MYNDLFSIGPVTFHMYGLMTAIGIVAAYLMMERRARQKQFTEEESSRTLGLILFCLIFGYLGSKILYVLTILPQLVQDPSLFRHSLTGGWVIFGGLLGGKFFDLAFPAVALAQAFGRVGCFFAGCCYGVETDSAFSVVFSHSDFAPNHVHLVPTQLISAALDLVLCLFLLWYEKHREKTSGELAAVYLILYSAGRFILEFWRGDLARGAVGPLSTSQFIGLFTLLAGIILFMILRTKTPYNDEKSGEAAHEEA